MGSRSHVTDGAAGADPYDHMNYLQNEFISEHTQKNQDTVIPLKKKDFLKNICMITGYQVRVLF